jgi:hypothetical protein
VNSGSARWFFFGLDQVLAEFGDLLFGVRNVVQHLLLVCRLGLLDLLLQRLARR